MPTSNTFFRAAVMLATGVLLVRGWQLFGPSPEQMKSFTGRAIELAHETWNGPNPTAGGGNLTADPQSIAPPLAAISLPPPGAPSEHQPITAQDVAPAFDTLKAPPVFAAATTNTPPALTPSSQPGPAAANATIAVADASDDRLPPLLARLEALGGVDPQLVPWGSSGRLYRFCCRASLADTPSFSRHFESVAAEPLVAVEEVVAKVEAWRTARREADPLR
jgi:hypothetical protein